MNGPAIAVKTDRGSRTGRHGPGTPASFRPVEATGPPGGTRGPVGNPGGGESPGYRMVTTDYPTASRARCPLRLSTQFSAYVERHWPEIGYVDCEVKERR